MRNPIAILGIIACVFVASCKTDDVGAPQTMQGENFVFYTDQVLYEHVFQERANNNEHGFTIDKIEPLKAGGRHILRITLTHARGCGQDFEVIWGGLIMESLPEQTGLLLRLPGACDGDNAPVERVLLVDLDEFIHIKDLVGRATFHIGNGSVAAGINDVSVSFR